MSDDDDDLTRALEAALVDGPDRSPPPDRVAALRARADERARTLAEQGATVTPLAPARPRPRRRDFLIGGVAASIGAAVGVAGLVASGATGSDDPPAPPMEAITFRPATGVRTDASLINHTWGIELVLDVEGLPAGTPYDVAYLGADGTTTPAGSFLAVDALMRCRFNAARLRADTTAITLTGPDGAELTRAELI